MMGLVLAGVAAGQAASVEASIEQSSTSDGVMPQASSQPVSAALSSISATDMSPASSAVPRFSSSKESELLLAQSIEAATDGTGSVVTQTGSTFDITGGTQTGANLFHSFEQLGLDAGQVANFLSNPAIQNILGRVVGGDPSVINGLLQVTGSSSNLFLMNPAGIVFGPNAQVIVPGAFTATTAEAVRLGDYWFNALGTNDYANLVGTPRGFAFLDDSAGAIINAGSIDSERSITLISGTVISTGNFITPNGNVTIATVAGERLVELTPEGGLLSIALPTTVENDPNISLPFEAIDLPALLTSRNLAAELRLIIDNGIIRLERPTIESDPGIIEPGSIYIDAASIATEDLSSAGDIRLLSNTSISADQIRYFGSFYATASNNIITGSITGETFGPNGSSAPISGGAFLTSENGNIRVFGIEAVGRVDIRSGGLFQATGTALSSINVSIETPSNIPRINIDLPRNVEIKNFLIRQQLLNADGSFNSDFLDPDGNVLISNSSDENGEYRLAPRAGNEGNNNLSLLNVIDTVNNERMAYLDIQGSPASVYVISSEVEENATINIKTIGQNIRLDSRSNTTVTGEGQQFILGPQAINRTIDDFEFVPYFPGALGSQTLAVRVQDYVALPFASEQFPEDSNGSAGLLVIGGSNTFFSALLQGIEYNPNPPLPPLLPPPIVPPSQTQIEPMAGSIPFVEEGESFSITEASEIIADSPGNPTDEVNDENNICKLFGSTEIMSISEVTPEECQF